MRALNHFFVLMFLEWENFAEKCNPVGIHCCMTINAQCCRFLSTSLGNEPSSCMLISSPSWFVEADQLGDTEVMRILDKLLHRNTVQGQYSVLLIVTDAKDVSSINQSINQSIKIGRAHV